VAQDGKPDGGMAAGLVERLLDVGIDGRGRFAPAQAVADAARREHPDVEAAVDAVVRRHLRLAATNGFVTSLGGFVTLPVALPANVVGFYAVATRMVAAVAALRGYDLSSPGVRDAVMLTLVGADADDLLRKAGVPTGGRLASLATQRLPGPAAMVINKGIGFRLIGSAGRSALSRFGKAVPVLGGIVGAGVDAYLLRTIAGQARRELPPRARAIDG
jgi:EcsC protein family